MVLVRTRLLKEESRPDKDTKSIEIPPNKKISALEITVKATNGGTSNRNNELVTCISDIKVTKTGDVIKEYGTNVAGILAQAIAFHRGAGAAADTLTEAPNETQIARIVIPFGRYIGDRQFFLDTSKEVNVALSISSDLEKNVAVGATGFQSGSKYIEVTALEFANEAIQPVGIVHTTHVAEFITEASGRRDINIQGAVKHGFLGRIYIRAHEAGTNLTANISEVDVPGYVDNEPTQYIVDATAEQFGRARVRKKIYASDTDSFDTFIGQVESINLQGATNEILYTATAVNGSTVTIGARDVSPELAGETAYNTDATIYASAMGKAYHNMFVIPFDLNNDIADLPAAAELPSKMWLTQSNAGARVSVLIDEIVPY